MLTALCTLSIPGMADDAPPTAAQSAPVMEAGTTAGSINLDGALDEPVWQQAPAITLTQQNPHPGAATPYITTVKVLRGTNYLYFGITATDPDPAHLSIHTLQRDGDQSADDSVMVVLDTFGQQKLAYVFQVNAGGAKADGLISPGYNNTNSNTPAVDYSWNGYWDAAVKRTADGWTAEIRIAAQSLQFPKRNAVWGLNVSRYVPRKLMTLVWSGVSLDATPTNLHREGRLTGIQGLDQGSGFEFDPYGVTEYSDEKHDTESYTGFDLKYNLTPELAGLLTYHTDFSEAQANSLNVSASPYAQSIPETRAFFLDGANIFTFSHNLGQNFIPFYSRSIGLVNGVTVPVDGGVKLLGHAGDWTLGMLDTQMADTDVSSDSNLFAGRAVYNVNSEWRVGGLVTRGDPLGQSDNTLTSLDSTWSSSTFQGDKNLNLSGWVARSSGQGLPEGNRGGYGFDAEYPNDLWYADLNYNFFGDALDPALGFLQRPGTKQISGNVTWQPRPGADSDFSWVRQFFENAGWYYVTGLDDHVQSDDWNFNPVQFTTQGGWHWNLQINTNYEVLAKPYSVVPEVTFPAGSYHFITVHSNMSSPTADDFVFGYSAEAGDLYSAHYKDFFPNVAWSAPGGHFTMSAFSGWLWIYGTQSDGILRVTELTLNYSFTPDLTLSTLTQYNSVSRTTSENAILQWNVQPGRIFYLVWNHGLTLNPNLLQGQQTVTGNTLVAKLVWGFY
ncbi:MAG TPA: carbohydrate binding family 9 domain-containing protein [Gammaproteobacteria bacterium]|nr:carbohydrate binding family 9 domain-containing protein [Gammaproteobacteria bacterium]